MVRKRWLLITLIWLLAGPVAGLANEELSGHFSFSAGVLLTDDDFSEAFDVDRRAKIGVVYDAKKDRWPASIAVEYFLSCSHSETPVNPYGLRENKDVEIYCTELYVGVKKIFDFNFIVTPYLAGGGYSTNIYAEISDDREYEGAYGVWFGAGGYLAISKYWKLNFEWRRTKAEADLFHHKLDVGGDHFHVSLGYCFPRPYAHRQ